MSVKLKKSNNEFSDDSNDQDATIGLYLLVAEILHVELNEKLLSLLRQPEVLETLSELNPSCREYITRDWGEQEYEEAAVDFCSLFVMPETKTSPRAAAWLPLGAPVTAEAVDAMVQGCLEAWQVQVPPSYAQLAYDHASLILYLAAVIRQTDSTQAKDFEAITLHSWISQLGKSLASTESASPIYRALGILLENLSD